MGGRGTRRDRDEPASALAAGPSRWTVLVIALATVTVSVPATLAGPSPIETDADGQDLPARRLPGAQPGLAEAEPRPLVEHVPQQVVHQATLVEEGTQPTMFPPATEPTIRPGRQILIDLPDGGGALCTMNFVYQVDDASGYAPDEHQPELQAGDHLIGTAGHCLLPSDLDDASEEGYQPPTVHVCVFLCAGSQTSSRYAQYATLGEVVYARQALDGEVLGQDYAFVKVPESIAWMIDPEVPVWSGASDTRQEALVGEQVVTYGQGVGVGDAELDARTGLSLGSLFPIDGGWSALIPVMQGDSGGPLLTYTDPLAPQTPEARALGDVTHSVGAGVVGVPGLAFGTLSEQGVSFTEEETGLEISLVTHPTELVRDTAS